MRRSCWWSALRRIVVVPCSGGAQATAALTLCLFASEPVRASWWGPSPTDRFQYNLQGPVEVGICRRPWRGQVCVEPNVYVIDLYDDFGQVQSATVAAIHARGARAVCYVNAGAWEEWRPDAGAYPQHVLGKPLAGWPGERWLDIRRTDVLLPLIEARVQRCQQAGFDGVDFDNVDGFTHDTGFPLTAADQLAFNRALAALAHSYNLGVGLKNDLTQLADLVNDFDFAVNEQCEQYGECSLYDATFAAAGKAVLQIEYRVSRARFCSAANSQGRSAIRKRRALRARPWQPCR